jgi:hypothetical protein
MIKKKNYFLRFILFYLYKNIHFLLIFFFLLRIFTLCKYFIKQILNLQ